MHQVQQREHRKAGRVSCRLGSGTLLTYQDETEADFRATHRVTTKDFRVVENYLLRQYRISGSSTSYCAGGFRLQIRQALPLEEPC